MLELAPGEKNSIVSPGSKALESLAVALDVPPPWFVYGIGDEPEWGPVPATGTHGGAG